MREYMQNKKCDKSKRNEVENCILGCPGLFFFFILLLFILARSHDVATELPPL
jgi:hypothetical protein